MFLRLLLTVTCAGALSKPTTAQPIAPHTDGLLVGAHTAVVTTTDRTQPQTESGLLLGVVLGYGVTRVVASSSA